MNQSSHCWRPFLLLIDWLIICVALCVMKVKLKDEREKKNLWFWLHLCKALWFPIRRSEPRGQLFPSRDNNISQLGHEIHSDCSIWSDRDSGKRTGTHWTHGETGDSTMILHILVKKSQHCLTVWPHLSTENQILYVPDEPTWNTLIISWCNSGYHSYLKLWNGHFLYSFHFHTQYKYKNTSACEEMFSSLQETVSFKCTIIVETFFFPNSVVNLYIVRNANWANCCAEEPRITQRAPVTLSHSVSIFTWC